MSNVDDLIALAKVGLRNTVPSPSLGHGGIRHRELDELLAQRNGFYCFEGALHVFASGLGERDLQAWNSPSLWRDAYDNMAEGCLFFAEDLVGNQFAIANDQIVLFDAETGDLEAVAESLEEWSAKVIHDCDYLTGYQLAHAWQEQHGTLEDNHRLIAKIPFVAGGEFALDNLYSVDSLKAMRWHGDLALQIRDLPDGAAIEFRIVP